MTGNRGSICNRTTRCMYSRCMRYIPRLKHHLSALKCLSILFLDKEKNVSEKKIDGMTGNRGPIYSASCILKGRISICPKFCIFAHKIAVSLSNGCKNLIPHVLEWSPVKKKYLKIHRNIVRKK